MSLFIKICGVTTPEDADLVGRAGADAIGVNFWSGSRRFVGDAAAVDVLGAVPAGVLKVGVFVNASVTEVLRQADRHGLDRVQLHGDERPVDFRGLPPGQLLRAIRVRDAESLRELSTWSADLFLLDAFVDGYGGAGAAAPWAEIARYHQAAGRPRARFLLAGGLHADNVAEAIALTRPDGVDVASGVEASIGRKSPRRVHEFIAAARAAGARLP